MSVHTQPVTPLSVPAAMKTNVNECCKRIFDHCEQPHIVFSHLLYGTDEMPGAIRLSSVKSRGGLVHEVQQSSDTKSHTYALKRHVQSLSRKNTFLHLVQRAFSEVDSPTRVVFRLVPENSQEVFYGPPEHIDNEIAREFTLKYSSSFAAQLVDFERARAYLTTLYESGSREIDIEEFHKEFDIYQYRQLCVVDVRGFEGGIAPESRLPSNFPVEVKNLDASLHMLAEFQSALLFCINEHDSPYTPITVCAHRAPNREPSLFSVAIITGELSDQELNIVFDALARCVSFQEESDSELIGSIIEDSREALPSLPILDQEALKPVFQNVFRLPFQRKRANLIGKYFVELLRQLSSAKHEGESIEFWFLAGDRSEFEDHPSTFFAEFQKDDASAIESLSFMRSDALSALRDNTQIMSEKGPIPFKKYFLGRISAVSRQLEKEHFPWFLRGRNALFWDISTNVFRPCGLVSLKRSSWEQVLNDLYRSEQESQSLPSFFLGYIGGSPREVGILRHDASKKQSRLSRVMRYAQDRWEISQHDERHVKLNAVLQSAMSLDDGPAVRGFVDMCFSIADNGRIGGTLILVDKDREEFATMFSKLGHHWRVRRNTLEDRIALIAHDGATLVEFSSNSWEYRFLLSSDGIDEGIRTELAKLARFDAHPLNSVGSRRWSAALASFKPGVLGVIVVSQDGDIQCWFSNPHLEDSSDYAETVVNNVVYSFPQNGKPKKLNYRRVESISDTNAVLEPYWEEI